MKSVLFACLLALAACGSSAPTEDMMSTDMSGKDMSLVPMTDGGGTLMYGDMCMMPGNPGDCSPGLICDMFAMNTVHRCTRLCDPTQPMNGCPPPSNGMCNAKNECKFTQ
jgi:hypothetical protein